MSGRPISVALDVLPLAGQPSGVGAACRGLLEALAARPDVELSAYAITRKPFVAHRELPGSVPFRGTPLPTRLVQGSWRLGLSLRAGAFVRRSDVVHGTNFSVPPSNKAKTVVTVHDLTAVRYRELCTPATRAYPGLVRSAVRNGAQVHVPSEFVRQEVIELLKLDPARVTAIHWGVPVMKEPTAPSPVRPPYILSLGTVEPRKDYPTLVEAFAGLAKDTPELRLVLAGSDGWGTGALTDAITRWRLEDKVLRLGYVNEEERSALLWNAGVLAYPSLYEGFGFPPLEAMAAGVPVVATRAGGVPEVVGDAAILVDKRRPEELSAALESVLVDREARERLLERGRARLSHFDWESTGSAMVELYRRASAG